MNLKNQPIVQKIHLSKMEAISWIAWFVLSLKLYTFVISTYNCYIFAHFCWFKMNLIKKIFNEIQKNSFMKFVFLLNESVFLLLVFFCDDDLQKNFEQCSVIQKLHVLFSLRFSFSQNASWTASFHFFWQNWTAEIHHLHQNDTLK